MRWLWHAGLALALSLVLVGCLTTSDSCACQYPADAPAYDVYLLTGFGGDARLEPVVVRDDTNADPAMVAVTALLHTTPPPEADRVNGWAVLEEPIVEVLAVDHRDSVVSVELSRDMWDPYPTVDLKEIPDGRLTLQQLVWTVQGALETDDPVVVTHEGEELRGVWFTRADWPVAADRSVLAMQR